MAVIKKNRPHSADYSAGVVSSELDVPPPDSNGKTGGDRFGGLASVVEQSIASIEVDKVHHQYLTTAEELGKLSDARTLTALAETLESALSRQTKVEGNDEEAPSVNATVKADVLKLASRLKEFESSEPYLEYSPEAVDERITLQR
jgi:hypothetical protein